jgi:hypothetical protein
LLCWVLDGVLRQLLLHEALSSEWAASRSRWHNASASTRHFHTVAVAVKRAPVQKRRVWLAIQLVTDKGRAAAVTEAKALWESSHDYVMSMVEGCCCMCNMHSRISMAGYGGDMQGEVVPGAFKAWLGLTFVVTARPLV